MTDAPGTPNPGSPEARELGCRCAVLDNHYGRYAHWGFDEETGEPLWVTRQDCPLHGRDRAGPESPDGPDEESGAVGDRRLSWDQPCCESCWFELEGQWDGDRLVSVRRPVHSPLRRLGLGEVVRCAWCGAPTFAGIYVRADPATLPFPASTPPERDA